MADEKRRRSVFRMAQRRDYATITWDVGDVRRLRPQWSDQQARVFLERVERHLAAATLLAGWAALESLIDGFEQEQDDGQE
jgi:hypothetical protein